jgi:hypothetical protein
MTVSSSVNKVIYSGNSATVLFPVNYYFLENSHLKVILRAADGTETVQALTTNYTVTGAGNPAGGSITMLVAPVTGTTLTIVRNVPATQETDYLANDPFPAESHERALDKLTMLTQENEEIGSRSIQIPQTDPVSTNIIVPKVSDRASRLLGFGAAGSVAVSGSTIAQVDAAVAAINTIASAPSGNSAGISHISLGSGATSTTVQAKLRETISVKDFGAVGDGVADDATAIQAAVTFAASNNYILNWPVGDYLITANIANLHTVKHIGNGNLLMGVVTFSPAPINSSQNTIYVSTTGNNANDGLIASRAVLTPQKAVDILKNYGPNLEGSWVVEIAAGTYNNAMQYPENLDSVKRVIFRGPDVVRTEPTVKIDGTALANTTGGWFFQTGSFIQINDIEFTNWPQYGLLFNRQQWDVNMFNVWTRNNFYGAGFIGTGTVQWRYGYVTDNTSIGVLCQDRCRHTIGWGATTVYSGTGPFLTTDGLYIARNSRGTDFSRLSYGYLQRCLVEDNVIGTFMHKLTRARCWENLYKDNTDSAIGVRDNSVLNQSNNSFSGNTNDVVFFSGAVSADDELASVRNLGSVGLLGGATGSYPQPATLVWTQHIPGFATLTASSVRSSRGMLRVRAFGDMTKGAAVSGRAYGFRLYTAAGVLGEVFIPSDVAVSGRIELEFVFSGRSVASQRGNAKVMITNGSYFALINTTVDLSTNQSVQIWTIRENASDTLEFIYATAEIYGEYK